MDLLNDLNHFRIKLTMFDMMTASRKTIVELAMKTIITEMMFSSHDQSLQAMVQEQVVE